MALIWFLHGKGSFILLLILENLSSVTPLAELESDVGLNLQCHNDYDRTMFCQFRPRPTADRPNCPDYSLNFTTSSFKKKECRNFTPREGFPGECSCSIQMLLVQGSRHTATLWSAGKKLESKVISITQTIKPKAPSITSVEETANGDFLVKWDSNYKKPSFTDRGLIFAVTYRKKEGKTEKVSENVTVRSYDIHGRDLEPSTEYVISVKSCTKLNDRCSDSSEEMEFTTRVSSLVILLAVIGVVTVAAVVVASGVFLSCVRVKSKFWDNVSKCPNPALLTMVPGEQKLLQPPKTVFYPVCVDILKKDPNEEKPWSKCLLPDDSSGGNDQQSSDSSSLGYAKTISMDVNIHDAVQEAMRKALPHLALPWSLSVTDNAVTRSHGDSRLVTSDYSPCSSTGDDNLACSAGSSSFSNRTYSFLVPARQQSMTSNSSVFPMQAAVLSCDPAYCPSEGDVLRNETPPDPQVPVCGVVGQPDLDLSPVVSPHMQTDFSYQSCDADPGSVSSAEGSSLSSISNDINTPVSCNVVPSVEAGYESFSEAVRGGRDVIPQNIPDVCSKETVICDMNPCFESLPAPLRNLPPTDDDHPALQCVVEQSDVLFPEENSIEEGEHLDKNPGGFLSQIPQSSLGSVPSLISNAQDGQCLPELGRPFLSALSAEQSEAVVTDSCYHSV